MTPQEKTIQKANFIKYALELGGTLYEAENAYKQLTLPKMTPANEEWELESPFLFEKSPFDK